MTDPKEPRLPERDRLPAAAQAGSHLSASRTRQAETGTPKVDVLERLLCVFTLEQLMMIADVCARIQARAIERGCRQGVEIVFNERGVPRFCNGTDDAVLPK